MEETIQRIVIIEFIMMIYLSTAEVEWNLRQPYGIKLCESFCKQFSDTCVQTMYTVDNLTCRTGLEQQQDTERRISPAVDKMPEMKEIKIRLTKGSKLNATCNEHSGRLVKVDSQEKHDRLLRFVKSRGIRFIVIGVYKFKGAWFYIDGEPVTYTAWDEDEDVGDVGCMYAMLEPDLSNLWQCFTGVINTVVCEIFP